MDSAVSPEEHLPEHDFDPHQLTLRVRVTLAADRKSVDPVVAASDGSRSRGQVRRRKEDAIELALQERWRTRLFTAPRKIRIKSSSAWWPATTSAEYSSSCAIPARVSIRGRFPPAQSAKIYYSNHGRGIFLINQLMDEVKFNKNGTEIHMVKR